MNLVWKLLRQHVSVPQFAGFFFANLVGMLIVMLGVQFYTDTQAVYHGEDSFMKDDYLIVNKQIGAVTTLTGRTNGFTEAEIRDIGQQPFVEHIGAFTSSAFDVTARFDVEEFARFSTQMFFESVPDEFIDVSSDQWAFRQGSTQLPIILPKDYLDLYNFGYAQSRNMPKLSEGILGAMKMKITVSDGDRQDEYEGRIVGFSSRLNTILVPQAFMDWANPHYAGCSTTEHTRLILQVNNPTDDRIASYLQQHNYQTDQDKLDASKTSFVLRVIVGIVMAVGLLICLLAFYILMLSVFLLVQKNSAKLENLLLVGYSPARVSRPYQLLAVGLNVLVWVLAAVLLLPVRHAYMSEFLSFFPHLVSPSLLPSLLTGAVLLVGVSVLNIWAVRQKVLSIWKNEH